MTTHSVNKTTETQHAHTTQVIGYNDPNSMESNFAKSIEITNTFTD